MKEKTAYKKGMAIIDSCLTLHHIFVAYNYIYNFRLMFGIFDKRGNPKKNYKQLIDFYLEKRRIIEGEKEWKIIGEQIQP